MKHFILILFFALAADAQVFGTAPGKVRRYFGTPTAGDCNAGRLGYIAANIVAIPTVYYSCIQSPEGTYTWTAIGGSGAGSGDVTGGGTISTANQLAYTTGAGAITGDASFTRSGLGKWTLYSGSGGSDATTLTVRAGAGQGSTPIVKVRNAIDTIDLFTLNNSGAVGVYGYASLASGISTNGLKQAIGYESPVDVRFSSDTVLGWSNTTSALGTFDLGLARQSAGLLKVTDGSTGFGQSIAAAYRLEESDTNPTCSAGDYHLYADLSETKLKKCQNGTASDLDTSTSVTAGPSGALVVSGGEIDVDTDFVCLKTGTCAPTGGQDWRTAAVTYPSRTAASAPGSCTEGESYYDTTLHARRDCTSSGVWTTPGGGASPVTALASGTVAASTSYCTGSVATLATVTIPANTLEVGDLLEAFVTFTHTGASTWNPSVALGNSGAIPSCCIAENNNGTATISARWYVAGTTDTRFSGVIERANGDMKALGYLSADTTSSTTSDMDLLLRVNCTSTESVALKSYSVRVTKF